MAPVRSRNRTNVEGQGKAPLKSKAFYLPYVQQKGKICPLTCIL